MAISFALDEHHIPTELWMDGQWMSSKSSDRHKLVSAVNEQVVTEALSWADADETQAAVESAQQGLTAWQGLSKQQRRDALYRYGQLIRDNLEHIFWLEAILVGKARSFTSYEVEAAVDIFTYFAGLIDTESGLLLSQDASDGSIKYTCREPYGVSAVILPFNGPLVCYCMKVAPALAAGNSLVIKASELNPLSTLLVASLSEQAGFPRGVINCITGGPDCGAALAANMCIRKISFTGSVETGKRIQILAAQSNLKSVTLGLGGKSPTIVFQDADIARAAQHCCQFLMLNGQGCMLSTRVYIHETILERVLAIIRLTVEAYEENLGTNPLAEGTWSSPLFHESQKARVLDFIARGKSEATLAAGSGEPLETSGYYIRPAVFINPRKDASILKEEIFGPVLVVCAFNDEDEVVKEANNSEFGLGAFVWTADVGRALRVSRALQAGSVGINGIAHVPWETNTPTTGWKQSGTGIENGVAALHDWSQIKSVKIQG